jgi:hypothetical protein
VAEAGGDAAGPRWWAARPARSQKPATYRCPFCDESLHAMSEHVVIAPEGDVERRRHAHTECVAAAHRAGAFVTHDEWRAAQPARPGLLARLIRGRRRSGPPSM